MSAHRRLAAILLVVAAAGLGGCHLLRGESCHAHKAYETAQAVPPLHAPEGLAGPNTRNALHIPDVPLPAKPRAASDPCLDEPPSFFPDRPKPGKPKA
jgi:uncharacterized lipoprotein